MYFLGVRHKLVNLTITDCDFGMNINEEQQVSSLW